MSKNNERRPYIFFDLAEISDDIELRARCRFHDIEYGEAISIDFPLEKKMLLKIMETMREALRRRLDNLL